MAKRTSPAVGKHDTPRTIFDDWVDEGQAARAQRATNISAGCAMAKAPNPADIPLLIDAARGAVEDLANLLDKIYSVSTAGQAFIGEEKGTEHGLFCVIEDMTSNTTLVHRAYRVLDDLASATKGASHG